MQSRTSPKNMGLENRKIRKSGLKAECQKSEYYVSSDFQGNKIRYLLFSFSEQVRNSIRSKLFMRKRKLPILSGHKMGNQNNEHSVQHKQKHIWAVTDTQPELQEFSSPVECQLYGY